MSKIFYSFAILLIFCEPLLLAKLGLDFAAALIITLYTALYGGALALSAKGG